MALPGPEVYSASCESTGSTGDDERPGVGWRDEASPYMVEYSKDRRWWGIRKQSPQ
jgi:hypothetical protein